MKKFLALFLSLSVLVFAFDIDVLKLTIQEVNEDEKTLVLSASNKEVLVGETGIIVHKISSGIISNSVLITDVQSDKILAKYDKFTLLEQKYLPTPIVKPKKGDEVILRSFYARGFIVAPNQKLYDSIKALYPKIHFVSSDLLIADVGGKGIIDPSKKGFAELCKIYSVGLIAIYASNGVNLLDCQSFEVLERNAMENPDPKEVMYPLFARVPARSFWDFIRPKKDYFKEYDKLLSK